MAATPEQVKRACAAFGVVDPEFDANLAKHKKIKIYRAPNDNYHTSQKQPAGPKPTPPLLRYLMDNPPPQKPKDARPTKAPSKPFQEFLLTATLNREEWALLDKELSRLEKIVADMRYGDDQDRKTIAQNTGKTENHVRVMLRRIDEKARQLFE